MYNLLKGRLTELKSNRSANMAQVLTEARAHIDSYRSAENFLSLEGNTLEYYRNFFGVMQTDSRLILLDPNSTDFEVNNIRKSLGSFRLTSELPLSDWKVQEDAPAVEPFWQDDRPRLMFMSSGTTSAPKGILHSYKNHFQKISLLRNHLTEEETRRALAILPVSFCYGLNSSTLVTLSYGGEVFLATPGDMQVMASFGAIMDEREITFTATTPTIWQMALRLSPPPKKKTLKKILIAAAPLSEKLYRAVKEWAGEQCEVMNVYGSTETCGVVTGPQDGEAFLDGYIGEAWAGEFKIEEGELLIRTPALFKGYEIDGVFHPEADGRWFHSGDAAIEEGSGYILKGRLKTMINKGGFKIYPEDLEVVALKHPAVEDCCAFAVPETYYGEVPALAVALKEGASLTDRELHEYMLKFINHLKSPSRYYFMEKIPRTARGKLDRKTLTERFSAP